MTKPKLLFGIWLLLSAIAFSQASSNADAEISRGQTALAARDYRAAFEAFKAGAFDFWLENQASRWATAYDFPAFKEGKVIKELVALEKVSGVMVGFVYNTTNGKMWATNTLADKVFNEVDPNDPNN